MQPGQIRVFDGLRVTTEHVTHLQGALHSALRDLRSIVGPGIYRGLQVALVNGSAVIQPGLGIDFEGNRVVRDDPVTLPIGEIASGEARFVCLKYDQIETGEVEGKPTLIWDSSVPVLTPELPDAKANLIVLARVYPAANGHLAIELPTSPSAATEPSAAQEAVTINVAQGIARISQPPSAPDHVRTLLAAALRRTAVPPADFAIGLARREMELPFEPTSLTCHVLIRLTITPAVGTEGETSPSMYAHARCSGEAIVRKQGITQFGICSSYGPTRSDAYGAPCRDDVTEAGIGLLAIPLDAASQDQPLVRILDRLRVAVRLAPGASATGVAIVCEALWSGEGGDTAAAAVEAALQSTQLEIVTAWKAQGAPSANTAVVN